VHAKRFFHLLRYPVDITWLRLIFLAGQKIDSRHMPVYVAHLLL
jgi:hypothetical protein